MDCENFQKVYWAHYISLEKEFRDTMPFVSIAPENKKTYSSAYMKLLLQIGSETDILLKVYCGLLQSDFKGKNMNAYLEFLRPLNLEFFTQKIEVLCTEEQIIPWENCAEKDYTPNWWKVYNGVKHRRMECETVYSGDQFYKLANQEMVLAAIAGLYQLEMYSYRIMATEEKLERLTPLPGSKAFTPIGKSWDGISAFGEFFFRINDRGDLSMEINPNVAY